MKALARGLQWWWQTLPRRQVALVNSQEVDLRQAHILLVDDQLLEQIPHFSPSERLDIVRSGLLVGLEYVNSSLCLGQSPNTHRTPPRSISAMHLSDRLTRDDSEVVLPSMVLPPARYYRHSLKADKEIRRATVYAFR